MSDDTMVDLLARELAKARTGGNVYMDGAHNPLPTEYVKARQFLEPLEAQNQALQEEKAEAMRKLVRWQSKAVSLQQQSKALQERAEKAEALVSSNRNLWDECYVLRQRAEKAEEERDGNQQDFLAMLENRNQLSDEWLKAKDQIEEMRLNFDGNLTAMGHPPHPKCKFRRLLHEADQ